MLPTWAIRRQPQGELRSFAWLITEGKYTCRRKGRILKYHIKPFHKISIASVDHIKCFSKICFSVCTVIKWRVSLTVHNLSVLSEKENLWKVFTTYLNKKSLLA
jgi:hypothetical protein